jgi:CHASE3 domain sensor protein
MIKTASSPQRTKVDPYVALGLLAVFSFFVMSGAIAYNNIRNLADDTAEVGRTHDVLSSLDRLLSDLKDAETGQRGFLLTGNNEYLGPYNVATTKVISDEDAVRALIANDATQRARFVALERHIEDKLSELKETIGLRKSSGAEAALAIVTTGRGKQDMDASREAVEAMQRAEIAVRDRRLAEMDSAFSSAIAGAVATAIVGLALTAAVAWLILRAASARALQDWL